VLSAEPCRRAAPWLGGAPNWRRRSGGLAELSAVASGVGGDQLAPEAFDGRPVTDVAARGCALWAGGGGDGAGVDAAGLVLCACGAVRAEDVLDMLQLRGGRVGRVLLRAPCRQVTKSRDSQRTLPVFLPAHVRCSVNQARAAALAWSNWER
jgi:hypothetical protein